MKILMIHNRYLLGGGEDECLAVEKRLLQQRGHQVEVYEKDNRIIAALGKFRVACKTVWSGESYQTVRTRLRESAFDLVHVHNFFPLISPSAYYAAKAGSVPVIQSLHNFRLLCANGFFFRDGRVCEDCKGKRVLWPGIRHACYRQSRAGTAIVCVMLAVHRLLNTWRQAVDCYIALTEFSRRKFIEGRLPAEKIFVKPNFVYPDPGMGKGTGGYGLFVGRLSQEKGIGTLLSAWAQLKSKVSLKIVGEGPLGQDVAEAAKSLTDVEWLGRQPSSKVYELMKAAAFLVFPSEWYETFGRVAVEAFATGTPIVAAKLGSAAEIVDSGRTGLHFVPGDPLDLASQMDRLLSNPSLLTRMRAEARAEFEAKYTAERNYRLLMDIYHRVLARGIRH